MEKKQLSKASCIQIVKGMEFKQYPANLYNDVVKVLSESKQWKYKKAILASWLRTDTEIKKHLSHLPVNISEENKKAKIDKSKTRGRKRKVEDDFEKGEQASKSRKKKDNSFNNCSATDILTFLNIETNDDYNDDQHAMHVKTDTFQLINKKNVGIDYSTEAKKRVNILH